MTAIGQANPGANPNNLQVGERLCIPGAVPGACPPGSVVYTIQPGDTLFALAQRSNTTVEAILRANPGLNPANLQIGSRICIPRPVGVCPTGSEVYTIQPGDTFFRLAGRFRTTTQVLLELNPGVNPNALVVGQRICVPRARLVYVNREYRVSFVYPADWQRIDDERYQGPDGFFLVTAAGGQATIEEFCRSEAFQVLRPYGSAPVIEQLNVLGQEACLILPSADQPLGMNNQAALIVRYPRPVVIDNQLYPYFVLYASKNYIREFTTTLEFLPAS